MAKSLHRLAGRYGALKKNLDVDDPRVVDAHCELVTLQLRAHIADVLAVSPPLRPEQIESIRAVLVGGAR